MATPVLLALAFMGGAWLVSGVVMAVPGRIPIPSAGLTIAGAATLAGTIANATGRVNAGQAALVLAWSLALPVAVTAYPRLAWRQPVDFLALATVVSAGGLATLQPLRTEVLEATGVVIGIVLVVHTWWKLERSDTSTRRALSWLAVVGGGAALVGLVVTFASPTQAGAVVAALAFALVGPAMAVGVGRPDLVDVRVVVVQVVVAAVVVIAYIAAFTALASLLEILLARPPAVGELAVTAAVVALPLPLLRTALRGVVDELLFGARADPIAAATHVADRSAGDPVLALRAVREALALPYAVLRVDGSVVASSGEPVTSTHSVPLTFGEGSVGELEVGLRQGDARPSRADEHALGLVAPLVALTARSSALAAELQEAREQSVTAIAEERRRLRRDLHDGLGPRLSGIAFTADAAHNSVRSSPETAEDLLLILRTETTTAIEEIRGLVYSMRPPAIDELGLAQAIRQQALALRTPEGGPVDLQFEAPEHLPPLTAAVEVAAYRIVVEALTNAARHSGGDRATARLVLAGEELVIEVCDEGEGGAAWRAGAGMSSMRERVHELGGNFEAGPTSTGGVVRARLPLVPASISSP